MRPSGSILPTTSVSDTHGRRIRVLAELRPAADGHAGIPHEARLIFALLARSQELEVDGLLNAHAEPISRSLLKTRSGIVGVSRIIASLKEDRGARKGRFVGAISSVLHQYRILAHFLTMKVGAALGVNENIYEIELRKFPDYIWSAFFSKSLSSCEFNTVTNGRFSLVQASWNLMHRVPGRVPPHRFRRLDTRGYDYFLAHTPAPIEVTPGTKLIVRYHDAIPIFYPHTVENPRWHQLTHYRALKANVENGALFVCNSDHSRGQLLSLFPSAEERAFVIPCVISDVYRGPQNRQVDRHIVDVVMDNLESTTRPLFKSRSDTENFYKSNIDDTDPYLICVSTIEPRKNHDRLISAWMALRASGFPKLNLILVGRPGWNAERTLSRIRNVQDRGRLFHLSGVDSSTLSWLYSNAAAVICPSITEGFDLTGVEAMASGGAVAASDIPVHREVYRDGCRYFDPYSIDEISSVIGSLVAGSNHDELRSRGGEISSLYTSEAVAPQWRSLLAKCLNQ